jgi:hypothetical protein
LLPLSSFSGDLVLSWDGKGDVLNLYENAREDEINIIEQKLNDNFGFSFSLKTREFKLFFSSEVDIRQRFIV